MKNRRVSVWDFVRAPFICIWIAYFAVMPENKTTVNVLFAIAVSVSIVTFIFQKLEDKKLQELVEEHNLLVDRWRDMTSDDGKTKVAWRSVQNKTVFPAIDMYADVLEPFLKKIPSWNNYMYKLRDMDSRLGKGPLVDLAEWVFYAQRGMVPDKYKRAGKSQICPGNKEISAEMRVDFFNAIDWELQMHGVESEKIVIVDCHHYILEQYLKHHKINSIPSDAEFTWAANCLGESIEQLLLHGMH